jgi:hypothetical protein
MRRGRRRRSTSAQGRTGSTIAFLLGLLDDFRRLSNTSDTMTRCLGFFDGLLSWYSTSSMLLPEVCDRNGSEKAGENEAPSLDSQISLEKMTLYHVR